MYFYYMLSAMGPEYQKYIWWKKYLTAFQMVSRNWCFRPRNWCFNLRVHLIVYASIIFLIIHISQVQFICIFIHQFQLVFTDCNYPKSFTVWIGLHGILFLVLFSGFYKEKYVQTARKKKVKCDDASNSVIISICCFVLFLQWTLEGEVELSLESIFFIFMVYSLTCW